MPALLTLRVLNENEKVELRRLAHGRRTKARLCDRARICWLACQGRRVAAIAAEVGVCGETAQAWIKCYNASGMAALADTGRCGHPPTYTAE